MCEFNVILDGKTVFKDVVYAKTEGDRVTVRTVIGESKEFKKCKRIYFEASARFSAFSTSSRIM
jgi:predicted RNA-binding protein